MSVLCRHICVGFPVVYLFYKGNAKASVDEISNSRSTFFVYVYAVLYISISDPSAVHLENDSKMTRKRHEEKSSEKAARER